MKIKIASWNIAGGHTLSTLKQFDYSSQDISYFIEKIRAVDPDIICLQESHTSDDGLRSNAQEIAQALSYPYVINTVCNPSHIEKGQQLSTAILSKMPFEKQTSVFYPDPSEPLVWKSGRPAGEPHHKNLQVVKVGDFSVANNQMLPLHLFNLAYDQEGVGATMAQGINEIMRVQVTSPVVWCGDFNFDDPFAIYPYLTELGLKEALPEGDTRPAVEGAKKRTDHILYSSEFVCTSSGIEVVNADHYLCWAEFDFK